MIGSDRADAFDILLLCEIPFLGVVHRTAEDRGFGFIRAGDGSELFFHVKGCAKRIGHDDTMPRIGDRILFMPGSGPIRRESWEAVRWVTVDEIDHDAMPSLRGQFGYDAVRRSLLAGLSIGELWELMDAHWYRRQWNGRAPADLFDPVLETVWKEAVAGLPSSEMAAGRFWSRVYQSRYRFSAVLHPEHPERSFEPEMFTTEHLLVLGRPEAAWMRPADESRRALLRRWHLMGRSVSEPITAWSEWYPGTDENELDLASSYIREGGRMDDFVRGWIDRLVSSGLADAGVIDEWSAHGVDVRIALFPYLPHEKRWSTIEESRDTGSLGSLMGTHPCAPQVALADAALAVDLETDGERIWEVGHAVGGKSFLVSESAGDDIGGGLSRLVDMAGRAPLMVGQNLLAWDWPIIARRTSTEVSPIIWDTLLVGLLLAPQRRSHSLGGRHHAHEDALQTLRLFSEQLRRFPSQVAMSLLAAKCSGTAQLVDMLVRCEDASFDYHIDAPMDSMSVGVVEGPPLLMTMERIRSFDWVPGVEVVSADAQEGLCPHLRRVDPVRLEEELWGESGRSPDAMIVMAVVRRAEEQGISVRRNMIPAWITERNTALSSALDRSSIVPFGSDGVRIAPVPGRVGWWTDPGRPYVSLIGQEGAPLLVSRGSGMLEPDDRRRLASVTTGMLRRERVDGSVVWTMRDLAALILDVGGGARSFTTVPSRDVSVVDDRASPHGRPRLATRRNVALRPGGFDQGGYWIEVLRSLREVASTGDDSVTILLIGSSDSQALIGILEAALASLGMGEIRPDHRSRRERLLRARARGHVVVDRMSSWSDWRGIARDVGCRLHAVVETLPLEEWYVPLHPSQVADASVVDVNMDVDVSSEAMSGTPLVEEIPVSVILASVPALVSNGLDGWLRSNRLCEDDWITTVIDPRLGSGGRELAPFFDRISLHEERFDAAETALLGVAFSKFMIQREEASTEVSVMERFLIDHWSGGGAVFTGFKPSQRSAIDAIASRDCNVLVSLPTGEGKSILFQVPALSRGLRNRRLTLVVSPLKALMKDQVERLRDLGFAESADYLSGDRPESEIDEVMQGVLDHRIVLLYVAPERMRSRRFIDLLSSRMESDRGLDHVVVDEAHCVNQWGYEFRPDYFHATDLLMRMCAEHEGDAPTPFVLLSATITASDTRRLTEMFSVRMIDGRPMPLLTRPEGFSNPLRSHIEVLPARVQGVVRMKDFEASVAERLPIILDAVSKARTNYEATGQRSAVLVFASSRRATELLSELLSNLDGISSDFFHAGMDVARKDEVYHGFREGEIDVLVATKAFGMGMDIPDIHWVIHLTPPTYIEDYLQEVGRIGRGAEERRKAGLDLMSAHLPFSGEDFDAMRSMRADNALRIQDIRSMLKRFIENAQPVEQGMVAVVPAEGYETIEDEAKRRASETKVRMVIYWLERAGILTLSGSLPDILPILIDPVRLTATGEGKDRVADLARLLKGLESASAPRIAGRLTVDRGVKRPGSSSSPGIVESVISRIGSMIGFMFGISRKETVQAGTAHGMKEAPKRPLPAIQSDLSKQAAVINLSQLALRSAMLKSTDDVMAALVDLEKSGAVVIDRQLDFSYGTMDKEPATQIGRLLDLISAAVASLVDRMGSTGRCRFRPDELVDLTDMLQAVTIKGVPQDPRNVTAKEEDRLARKRSFYRRCFENGFRSLARSSGIRLLQVIDDDGLVVWEAGLVPAEAHWVRDRARWSIRQLRSLLKVLPRGEKRVPAAAIIDAMRCEVPEGRFRTLDLKKVSGLLAAIRVVHINVDLLRMSHVLMFGDDPGDLVDSDSVWSELAEISAMAESRNTAMEIFCNVRPEAREGFINGYFAQVDSAGMKSFLEDQLGEMDDPDGGEEASSLVIALRDKLRATKAVEFFRRYEDSEEPQQWEAIRHRHDGHLLVNAGPGSGKTSVLVARIVHLIREQGIRPSQIVVLAFNRAVVSEIRQRVRALFQSLGYAAYASRVRVHTMHGFAVRHMRDIDGLDGRKGLEDVLGRFAERMASDEAFRTKVAGDARSILVDEFQDMSEGIYSIIRSLHEGTHRSAGVMVIGDDDQDILRWNRTDKVFSETYFERFVVDFGPEVERMFLTVNFRSSAEIVDKSQAMISGFFAGRTRSRRLKTVSLRACSNASPLKMVERIEWKDRNPQEAFERLPVMWRTILDEGGGSMAVLCRSNSEVAVVHRYLSERFEDVVVQGVDRVRIADLRHIGLWLDHVREEMDREDRLMSDDLWEDLLSSFTGRHPVPECHGCAEPIVSFRTLWRLCLMEQSFPRLSGLVEFIEDLDSDELSRLIQVMDPKPRLTISTIHKVKGLEFDGVVVLPSTHPFKDGADMAGNAAEEARLFYVAMTRAKKRLCYFVGDRELAWGSREPRMFTSGNRNGTVLSGSGEDVGLGWALDRSAFNPDPDECQEYIRSYVRVGDRIALGGRGGGAYKTLCHVAPDGSARQIGFLALKHGAGTADADLRVSSVVRFTPDDPADLIHADAVRRDGWGYVVLVAGRLR